jgi:hypothetical protein
LYATAAAIRRSMLRVAKVQRRRGAEMRVSAHVSCRRQEQTTQ